VNSFPSKLPFSSEVRSKIGLFLTVILLLQLLSLALSNAVDSPTITTQPASANPALNSQLTISAQANVTDGGTLTYQWRFRATNSDTAANLSDTTTATYRITGTNSATVTIDTVTAAVSGLYSVRITNTVGQDSATVTSNEANIFVLLANEDFQGASLTTPADWVMTYKSAYNNAYSPCLTAANGNNNSFAASSTTQTVNESSMPGCSYSADNGSSDTSTAGQGALRLTSSVNNQSTFVLYNQSLSTNSGLDISFNASMWGSQSLSSETVNSTSYKFAADGLTFFLKDGEDTSTDPGAFGGSLGYSSLGNSTAGISSALLGIGLDGYGNFSGRNFGGTDCYSTTNLSNGTYSSRITRNGVTTTTTETFTAAWYQSSRQGNHGSQYSDGSYNIGNQIVVRGPVGAGVSGNTPTNLLGYCPISSNLPPKVSMSETTSATSSSGRFFADGIWTTRNANNTHLYRVLVDGSTISNPRVKIYVDGTERIDIPVPRQFIESNTFKFGFSASTGGANQKIDVWSMRVSTYTGITTPDPPTNVTVSQTSGVTGSFDVNWSHNGLWGIGEAASGTRQFVATVYNSAGTTATNFSCTVSVSTGVPGTSCSIANIPAGTYTVRVVAINRSNLSSTISTVSGQITSNGDTTITDCSGAGAIINGSFEQTNTVSYLASPSPTGWRTTARATRNSSDQYVPGDPPPATAVKANIELTTSNTAAAANVTAFAGTRLIEIAADGNGGSTQGVYQDVNTLVGSRVFWSYQHHRRTSGGAATEVSRFRSAPTPVDTSTGNITVPAADVWTISEQGSPFGAGATLLADHYDTATSNTWTNPSGQFEPSTSRTRFLFSNHAPAGAGSGNLIDDVRFTTYAACPISVRIVAGRASNFVVRNVEQDTSTTQILGNTFRYYAPAAAEISALSGIPTGLSASVSNVANTSSTFALSASQVGTYTLNYRVSYVFSGTTYRTTSTLSVEVVPEVTATFPATVPFDPTLTSKNLPGIRFATATNAYVCFDQVANLNGDAISPTNVGVNQSSLADNVSLVSTGPPLIDTGTVSGLTNQARLVRITANSGVLGSGGSKFLRVRASSIDNTDGVLPSCASGISFVVEFKSVKVTQTRRYLVPLKNGRQSG